MPIRRSRYAALVRECARLADRNAELERDRRTGVFDVTLIAQKNARLLRIVAEYVVTAPAPELGAALERAGVDLSLEYADLHHRAERQGGGVRR